ncbi:MAG TPA: hypothetical protein VGX25_18230 [Actinophytocola sp.]|nr:hypothetical protein [Actinophytocola sp.]HEV2781325.1 hypothetical protein [Actinophytocola sp.]
MTLRRRLATIAATIALLATAIEYALMVTPASESTVATGGTIIVQN